MANTTAGLLDRNVIGKKIRLEDILKDSGTDFFTVPGVIGELEEFRRLNETGVTNMINAHKRNAEDYLNRSRNKNYREICDYLDIVGLETAGAAPDPYIARLLYEGVKRNLQINFECKNPKRIKKYFEQLKERYSDAIGAIEVGSKDSPQGIEFEITDKCVKIYKTPRNGNPIKPKKFEIIKIKEVSDLEKNFLRYEVLKETEDKRLALLTEEYKEYFDAMEVLKYFRMHPDKVLVYETDELSSRFTTLTSKSAADEVRRKMFGNILLKTINENMFREAVNQAIIERLDAAGLWDSSLNTYLAAGVNCCMTMLERCVTRGTNLPLDCGASETDANLVSAAIQLENDQTRPRYKAINLYSNDSDVIEIILLHRHYNNQRMLPQPKVRWMRDYEAGK